MNQTENKLNDIIEMANAAGIAVSSMMAHVADIQKNLSNEDQEKLNEALKKVNSDSLLTDLNKAQSNLSDVIKSM